MDAGVEVMCSLHRKLAIWVTPYPIKYPGENTARLRGGRGEGRERMGSKIGRKQEVAEYIIHIAH